MKDNLYFSGLREAWEQFFATGEIAKNIRPTIAHSWMRCLKNDLNPRMLVKVPVVDGNDFKRRSVQNKHLLAVGRPIMDELQSFVKGTGYITLLTDCDGVILEMFMDEELGDVGLEKNLVLGCIWKEEQAGTSAIGLAIRLVQPIQVIGAEHYFESDLFGYEGEAFTGANRNGRPGKFELAEGGWNKDNSN